jgi:hypothetical protein
MRPCALVRLHIPDHSPMMIGEFPQHNRKLSIEGVD